jgi:hypothetical protein
VEKRAKKAFSTDFFSCFIFFFFCYYLYNSAFHPNG